MSIPPPPCTRTAHRGFDRSGCDRAAGPARSTIGLMLERTHVNGGRKLRRHATPSTEPLAGVPKPNQVMGIELCVWRNGDAVSDVFPVAGTDRYESGGGGIDRGIPAVWRAEADCAGEPQHNGWHERMHRTLKQDTAQPPALTLGEQQQRFGAFVKNFDNERPHQALGGATPANSYQAPAREFPEKIGPWPYASQIELRKTVERGKIRWTMARCRLSAPCANEGVGLETEDESLVWSGAVSSSAFRSFAKRAGKAYWAARP